MKCNDSSNCDLLTFVLHCTKLNCWNFINVQKVGLTSLKLSHLVLHKGQTLDSFHPFISLGENERYLMWMQKKGGSERAKRRGLRHWRTCWWGLLPSSECGILSSTLFLFSLKALTGHFLMGESDKGTTAGRKRQTGKEGKRTRILWGEH